MGIPFILLSLFLGQQHDEDVVALQTFFANDGADRESGKATFLRRTFRKSVDLENTKEPVSPETRNQLQRLLGAEFDGGEDTVAYDAMRVYFDDQGRKRKELHRITSEDEFVRYRDGGSTLPTEFSETYVFTGDMTKTLKTWDGETPKHDGTILPQSANLQIPQFQSFGLNDSGKDALVFLNALEKGEAVVTSSTTPGGYTVDYILPEASMHASFVFPSKGSLFPNSVKLYIAGALLSATFNENPIPLPDGKFYPQRRVDQKYMRIDGQDVLVFEQEYILVGQHLAFNQSMAPDTFTLDFPGNTPVTDFRQQPPLDYVIPDPSTSLIAVTDESSPLDSAKQQVGIGSIDNAGSDSDEYHLPMVVDPSENWNEIWPFLLAIAVIFSFMIALAISKVRRDKIDPPN